MTGEVQELYGNRLRIRACGLLPDESGLLMVNHKSVSAGDFWSPPGGGINFAEPAAVCLKREFIEETGLQIEIVEFLFATEFIQSPLHAIELFFRVKLLAGTLSKGHDPEMTLENQIIQDVRFLSWAEIGKMKPESLHGIFRLVPAPAGIMKLRGYLSV